MRIEQFSFREPQIDEFVQFGYDLYAGDDNWIPPLETELRHQLSPDFAFFADEGNRCRHFLATEHGKVRGRLSAMLNEELRGPDGERVGTIGFFESVRDYGVASDLLTAAVTWLQDQGQVSKVWGPVNFDIWHGYRFMTSGFDQALFQGEPYNPAYYPEFFKAFGFNTYAEWDSVEIAGRETLERMIERGEKRYRMLLERGYRFEPFQRIHWDREVARLHRVLCASFAGFPGFTPVTCTEFARLFARGKPGFDPRLFGFVHNETDELVGFAGGFVDVAAAVRAMHGQQDLLAKVRFLRERKHADRVNFYLGGITPQEAARGTGLGRAGFYYVVRQSLAAGYDDLLMTLRRKGSPSRAMTARHAPTPQREYALYELPL
jgi:predicted GNAT family N-acyltransferase